MRRNPVVSVRSRLAAVHPLTWVVTALAVAALIAWPLGGWDTVEPSSADVPRLAVGSTHDGKEFATRIVSATVGTASPRSFDRLKTGQAFLIVTADLENVTDSTQSSAQLADLLRIDGVVGAPSALLASDRTFDPDLVPGLRMRLLLVWTVKAADFRAGRPLPISIVDRTPYQAILLAGTAWRDPRVAVVTTPSLRTGPAAVPDGAGS
jgi:hypothetical protein